MKTSFPIALAALSTLATDAAFAQSGNMMNGGTWGAGWMGGYGGIWTPILLVIVIAGVVAWIISSKRK